MRSRLSRLLRPLRRQSRSTSVQNPGREADQSGRLDLAELPRTAESWDLFVEAVDAETAQEAARELEKEAGLGSDLLLRLIDFWREAGDWTRLAQVCALAEEAAPEALPVILLRADLQHRSNRPTRERASLEAALAQIGDGDVDLRRTLRLRIAAVDIEQRLYADAWQVFQSEDRDAFGRDELLNLAFCAVHVGAPEAAGEAYTSVAPSDSGGVDVIAAAALQISRFQRAEEALRLLDLDRVAAETARGMEVRYRALLLLGRTDAALTALAAACALPGHSVSSAHALGQLLELTGRTEEAISAYRRGNECRGSALQRFRAGSLMIAEHDDYRAAAEFYLAPFEFPRSLKRSAFAGEVDPQVPELLGRIRGAEPGAERVKNLERLFWRLSFQSAIAPIGLELAKAYLDDERAEDAWSVIQMLQSERLPAVSLRKNGKLNAPSVSIQYAEMVDTLPIDETLVFWEANLGGGTSCNPLAICLAMLDDPRYVHMKHMWTLVPGVRPHPRLLGRENVAFVARESQGGVRALATAGYLVNNATQPWFFSKRAGQRLLNTWHGVPWKTLGTDRTTDRFSSTAVPRALLAADLIIAPDQHTREALTRSAGIFELTTATLMRVDYPRNDLAVNLPAERRREIREVFGLRAEEQLVVFMPTWRGTFSDRSAEVDATVQSARDLGGRGYRVVLRAHHYVRAAFTPETAPQDVSFASEDIDTYELLGAADALVTDYSSVLFDAAAMGLPVVKLVGDIDDYRAERGLYFAPDEVPGANAPTAVEARALLDEALRNPREFTAEYDEQTLRFGSRATGHSSTEVIDVFFAGAEPRLSFEEAPRRHRLLLGPGGLRPNGITGSLRNLVHTISSQVEPTLYGLPRSFQGADAALLRELELQAILLPRTERTVGTQMEIESLRFFNRGKYAPSALVSSQLDSALERMATQVFGDASFDSVVDFGGYHSLVSALFAKGLKGRAGKRGIVLHNDFAEEARLRFPTLASTLTVVNDFDFVASVSDGLREKNAQTIDRLAMGAPAAQITLPNTLNLERIRSGAQEPLEQEHLDWYASPGRHAVVLGRFSPEKNHEMLVEALGDYLQGDSSRPVTLSFLGDGPTRPAIEALVAELHLEKQVRFLGLVSNPFNHLRAADALYLPSKYEGQPMVLLEALTVGTPSVATDIPGSRSVLRDGELGSLVPLTRVGVLEGVRIIAEGRAVPATGFDADAYNGEAAAIFLRAIGVDSATA